MIYLLSTIIVILLTVLIFIIKRCLVAHQLIRDLADIVIRAEIKYEELKSVGFFEDFNDIASNLALEFESIFRVFRSFFIGGNNAKK